jgi:hypothetical protein
MVLMDGNKSSVDVGVAGGKSALPQQSREVQDGKSSRPSCQVDPLEIAYSMQRSLDMTRHDTTTSSKTLHFISQHPPRTYHGDPWRRRNCRASGWLCFSAQVLSDKVDCLASTAVKYQASSLATWQHRESREDMIEMQVEHLC